MLVQIIYPTALYLCEVGRDSVRKQLQTGLLEDTVTRCMLFDAYANDLTNTLTEENGDDLNK